MDVTLNIKELLYQHDCVILPEFGGFIANYIPASIDYDRNIFNPPSKKISFNSQLVHNDGLLISSVSVSSGLGYKDARKLVDSFVTESFAKLKKGKRLSIENLGSFVLDNDKTLQFEPDNSVNYLVHSFGFSRFEFEELEEFDVRKRIQPRIKEAAGIDRKARNRIIRRTVIAIPVIVALTLLPLKTNIFKSLTNTTSFSPVNNSLVEDRDPVTKPQTSNAHLPVIEEEAATLPLETEEVEQPDLSQNKVQVLSNPANFYVIVGSFKDRTNAERLQSKLRDDGHSGDIFETSSNFFRVALDAYQSYSEAKNAMGNYAVQNPEEKYWILEK